MITINRYAKLIEDFFKGHNQINTVTSGDDFDFNADNDIIYPVVNSEFLNQNISGDSISHQFEIIIADIYDANVSNGATEIYNDCNLIAVDFIDWLSNQYEEDYEINDSISIKKFTDGNVDRVGGCVFVVTFTQFREANSCIIPIDSTIVPVAPDVLKLYYGVITHQPNWIDLTSLNSSYSLIVNLNTGENKMFVVAVLNDLSIDSIFDITASNLDLTDIYQLSGSITNDGLTYDLYIMEQAINYSGNHIHRVTIK
jgi:hypothetical protein